MFFIDFFDSLRNEVDIYFTEQEKSEVNDGKWLEIIEKIKSIESVTYQQLPSNINRIKNEISDEISQSIDQFERQISSLYLNSTDEEINKIKKEIDGQKFKIERILFGNKTICFLKDFKIKKKNCTFLLVINDAYINKNFILQSEKLNSLRQQLPELPTWLQSKYEKKNYPELTIDGLNKILLTSKLSETVKGHIKEFNLNDIKELDLGPENDVGKIHENAFNDLINLEKLNLKFNNCELQPNIFKCLTNLKELILAFNQLTKAPNLSSLLNLKMLLIGANKLKRVPDLRGLFNLKEVNLGFNKIDEIDSDTFDGLSLEKLLLPGNHLDEINFEIPSLKELILCNNHIRFLSSYTFRNFPLLETLNLNSNLLSSIQDDTFLCLPNLVNLDLGDNYIKKLSPKAFSGLKNLEILVLDNCRINVFHDELFQPLTSLKSLSITNDINIGGKREQKGLKEINLKIFKHLLNLEKLKLRHWAINSIEENHLKSLPKLEVLDIKHSKLSSCVSKNFFNELTSLKEIRYSHDQTEFFEQFSFRENTIQNLTDSEEESDNTDDESDTTEEENDESEEEQNEKSLESDVSSESEHNS